MPASLTPAQIRGARGMLDWSMVDLSRAASVSVSTVKRIEMTERQSLSDEIRLDVQNALERAGVTFRSGQDGIGMMLRPL